MSEQDALMIHKPEILEAQIRDCERQLRTLKSYLRASKNYYHDGEPDEEGEKDDMDKRSTADRH